MSIHEQRHRMRQAIPRRYSPLPQIVLLHGVAVGLVIAAWPYLLKARPLEWLLLPAIFVAGNLLEWWLHRGPLHHPESPVRPLRRHSSLHHAYFTRQHLAVADIRDIYMVLHPWWTVVAVLVVHLPPAAALWFFVSPAAGAIAYLGLFGYFLLYEWLHLLHHLPPSSGLTQVPGLARLRAHHAVHHDSGGIRSVHCNVSFPLWDFLLGTRVRRER